jgi:hypothetical protein
MNKVEHYIPLQIIEFDENTDYLTVYLTEIMIK